MKKNLCWIIAACLAIGLLPSVCAESAARPRVILYTYYRQQGWGDRVQIGCVDEEGGLWLRTGHDSSLKWPYQTEEQLARLARCGEWEEQGRLSSDELFTLQSLIDSTPDQGRQSHPAACDAGTEYSYAVRREGSGAPRCVLLGMSGDDCFENTDPNAQALYRCLRLLFPQVTCYGEGMGPAGFQPVPLRAFCGWEQTDFSEATVTAYFCDCEAGPRETPVAPEERAWVLRLVTEGKVTGKASARCVTGGTTVYSFCDPAGKQLASLTLYRGWLVRPDGMYSISDR